MSIKKQMVLQTALRLFNQYGYASVGTDRLINESNVAKMTFYKYFGSKENLIMECLKATDNIIREEITKAVDKSQNSGKSKLEGVFDYYSKLLNSKDFHGSLFIKAANEFPENDTIARIAITHKKWLVNYFQDILGNEDYALLLFILLNGAIVRESIYRDKFSLSLVRNLFNKLDIQIS